jgi:hypothetical protein
LTERRESLHLLLGDVEPDPGIDGIDGADRDGNFLVPPQVALLQEDVSHLVTRRVHDEALYLADLTVGSVDALMSLDLGFAHRDGVLDDQRLPVTQAHADPHARG